MSHAQSGSGAPPVRASDTERDHAAEVLRAGYAEGRLTRAELDERTGAVYAARTRGDLRDLTGDLPGATSASMRRDSPAVNLPVVGQDPAQETGVSFNPCLFACLLVAFPPAGIAYWLLAARHRPQPGLPQRSELPGAGAAG